MSGCGTLFIFPAMIPVLEAVPNFSEGRDPAVVAALKEAIAGAGAEILDWSSDPDHHRSVITYVGDPATVEAASVAAARVAVEEIDLREHEGVHPRVGALDVLPFVPLEGLTLEDARESAHRVGEELTRLGLPVYFYGHASDPPGRVLAQVRKGGFEGLSGEVPPDRQPDLAPQGWEGGLHPTAGATCVGARELLLAWNVEVEGVGEDAVERVARSLRETNGGPAGVRALGLVLPEQGRMQVSMNVEDLDRTDPFHLFRMIEDRIEDEGGRVTGTEVIGMVPDQLLLPAAADRLALRDPDPGRLLSRRVARHLSGRDSVLEGS